MQTCSRVVRELVVLAQNSRRVGCFSGLSRAFLGRLITQRVPTAVVHSDAFNCDGGNGLVVPVEKHVVQNTS